MHIHTHTYTHSHTHKHTHTHTHIHIHTHTYTHSHTHKHTHTHTHKHTHTQDLRVFCSEVVGMLREKDPMICQLRDLTQQVLAVRRKALWKLRREEQEDIIHRVKEVRY